MRGKLFQGINIRFLKLPRKWTQQEVEIQETQQEEVFLFQERWKEGQEVLQI
jgi:hypothetical protein